MARRRRREGEKKHRLIPWVVTGTALAAGTFVLYRLYTWSKRAHYFQTASKDVAQNLLELFPYASRLTLRAPDSSEFEEVSPNDNSTVRSVVFKASGERFALRKIPLSVVEVERAVKHAELTAKVSSEWAIAPVKDLAIGLDIHSPTLFVLFNFRKPCRTLEDIIQDLKPFELLMADYKRVLLHLITTLQEFHNRGILHGPFVPADIVFTFGRPIDASLYGFTNPAENWTKEQDLVAFYEVWRQLHPKLKTRLSRRFQRQLGELFGPDRVANVTARDISLLDEGY